MGLEGAYVTESAPSHKHSSSNSVHTSLLLTSPASSLTSLPFENFPELLPVAYSYDTDLDLQFAMPVYSGALTAYSDPLLDLAPEQRQEDYFTDRLYDDSYSLTYSHEATNFNFATHVDAFSGANTNVSAERNLCLNIDVQGSEPVHEIVKFEDIENLFESDIGLFEQLGFLFDDSSDLFLVDPNNLSYNNMSYNNMSQAETGAMILDSDYSPKEIILYDAPEYTHTAEFGGAGSLVPALETATNPQNLSKVPRSFQKGNAAQVVLDGRTDISHMIRKSAKMMKIIMPYQARGPHISINSQNSMAKGRKKSPQGSKKLSAAAQSKERVTKPLVATFKKPKRMKRVFDYSEAKVNTIEVPCPELRNRLVTREQIIEALGDQFDHSKAELVCDINRRRYVRESLDGLEGLHPNVAYEKNYLFNISHPYQQEFTRVELDPTTGAPIKETRSALCCYCEDLRFYELKNSCYSQHMSHSHGVYTDNSLAPDPILQGKYSMSKKFTPGRKTTPRPRDHPGVVCPVCLDLIEVCCWSSTREKNPLSNYLRHFRDKHRVEKRKETFFNLKA
ncbi:protein of unknown function DUF4451 [Metschnikowia aff. pulcherrima]|uniref:Transcription regulator Rua1 C-terminal domain-containing protein n=1 Tax=Metschnikowia aff. pulcherrima TaxID=2163413 RepID=A0A4P6XN14_9ASCO|nr:protein of unknown function DUF4451 [Metschnikowia aff. pulcherrima]